MIRPATHDDFLQWRALAERCHNRSPFSHMGIDLAEGSKAFRNCLASKLGTVLVAERGGRITGTIIGVAQEWWWCRKRVASDLMLYAEHPGDGLSLLRHFITWAWTVPGVTQVMCSQSSGIQTARSWRIYQRAGMRCIGGLYLIDRPPPVAVQEKVA